MTVSAGKYDHIKKYFHGISELMLIKVECIWVYILIYNPTTTWYEQEDSIVNLMDNVFVQECNKMFNAQQEIVFIRKLEQQLICFTVYKLLHELFLWYSRNSSSIALKVEPESNRTSCEWSVKPRDQRIILCQIHYLISEIV